MGIVSFVGFTLLVAVIAYLATAKQMKSHLILINKSFKKKEISLVFSAYILEILFQNHLISEGLIPRGLPR